MLPLKLEVVTSHGGVHQVTIKVPETIKTIPTEAMLQNLAVMRFFIDADTKTIYNMSNLTRVTVKE